MSPSLSSFTPAPVEAPALSQEAVKRSWSFNLSLASLPAFRSLFVGQPPVENNGLVAEKREAVVRNVSSSVPKSSPAKMSESAKPRGGVIRSAVALSRGLVSSFVSLQRGVEYLFDVATSRALLGPREARFVPSSDSSAKSSVARRSRILPAFPSLARTEDVFFKSMVQRSSGQAEVVGRTVAQYAAINNSVGCRVSFVSEGGRSFQGINRGLYTRATDGGRYMALSIKRQLHFIPADSISSEVDRTFKIDVGSNVYEHVLRRMAVLGSVSRVAEPSVVKSLTNQLQSLGQLSDEELRRHGVLAQRVALPKHPLSKAEALRVNGMIGKVVTALTNEGKAVVGELHGFFTNSTFSFFRVGDTLVNARAVKMLKVESNHSDGSQQIVALACSKVSERSSKQAVGQEVYPISGGHYHTHDLLETKLESRGGLSPVDTRTLTSWEGRTFEATLNDSRVVAGRLVRHDQVGNNAFVSLKADDGKTEVVSWNDLSALREVQRGLAPDQKEAAGLRQLINNDMEVTYQRDDGTIVVVSGAYKGLTNMFTKDKRWLRIRQPGATKDTLVPWSQLVSGKLL